MTTQVVGKEPDGKTEKTYSEAELQEHVKRATATAQKELTATQRTVNDLQADLRTLKTTATTSKEELEALRRSEGFSGDPEGHARWVAQQRQQIAVERDQLNEDTRAIRAKQLAVEFPHVAEADLLRVGTPTEMEIFALRQERPEPMLSPNAVLLGDGTHAGSLASPTPPTGEEGTPKPDRGGSGGTTGTGEPGSLKGTAKIADAISKMPNMMPDNMT